MDRIKKRVHELYWEDDINCARTMLTCLSELFSIVIEQQTMASAVGLHGAGGFRAQCGLVEGGLMFISIYYNYLGKTEEEIVSACYQYAEGFQKKFGSLSCHDLRPGGFAADDPPHLCENFTCDAVEYAYEYITLRNKRNTVLCSQMYDRSGIL